jgi:ABC-2 type transport system ATP-binding protein
MPKQEVIAVLDGVSKRYGDVVALDDVNISVSSGELLAVLGPNGAGKTTTVSLLLGLIRPERGSVSVFGTDPDATPARVRVGAMLQVSNVPETMKVREHIHLFRSYYPNPLDAEEVIRAAGLEGLENRFFGKLSGGQKQRVMFALAICGNPQLLFLDEPTVGLDVESRRAFWSVIRTRVDQGRTVVLTTHFLEEADALADRILVINRGRVIAEGTPAEIKSRTAARRIRCTTRLGVDELEAIPDVVSVNRNGVFSEILTGQAENVTRILLNKDAAVENLEISGAGLEDAFLTLTREEEQQPEQEQAA